MPLYLYHCDDNGRTVEVRHGMSDRVETWGALCELADAPRGTTPANAPVERVPATSMIAGALASSSRTAPGASSACCPCGRTSSGCGGG